MFVAGDVVKNRITSSIATVTEVLGNDRVRVRFDGEISSVELHASRFQSHTVLEADQPFPPVDPETFKKGDYIQVTDGYRGTVKGAALSQLDSFGYATFDMLTDDGRYLEFNSNYVTIDVLFRADIARGQMPNY